jgi:3-deoxy-manno-octulosonate cytidylyltransferase (CMP-KDO synthetase)
MIEHVYRRVAASRAVDAVGVATDDRRIADAVVRFGGFARLTAGTHSSGTDRLAEAVRDLTCEVVVNVQGDLPMLDPEMIAQVVEPFDRDPSVLMTTLRTRITNPEDDRNANVVKVVVDAEGDALYFSRAAIPHARVTGHTVCYKHIGLYAYRRPFLVEFAQLPHTPLELTESLEQLRALEHGFRIRTVETRLDSVEVDTPEDLARVRRLVTAAART